MSHELRKEIRSLGLPVSLFLDALTGAETVDTYDLSETSLTGICATAALTAVFGPEYIHASLNEVYASPKAFMETIVDAAKEQDMFVLLPRSSTHFTRLMESPGTVGCLLIMVNSSRAGHAIGIIPVRDMFPQEPTYAVVDTAYGENPRMYLIETDGLIEHYVQSVTTDTDYQKTIFVIQHVAPDGTLYESEEILRKTQTA